MFELCHCGCGEPTELAKRSNKKSGAVKGKPLRFINGHQARVQGGSVGDRLLKYKVTGSGCHEWQGATTKEGYGVLGVEGKVLLVHRVAYEHRHGPIPPALFVLHSCDNPRCFRDEHLFLGTHQQNMDDKVAKGRQSTGRNWQKYTLAQLDAAVAEWRDGKLTQVEVAAKHGISRSHLANHYRLKTA